MSGYREQIQIQHNTQRVGSFGGRGEHKCASENQWATCMRDFSSINRHRSSRHLGMGCSAPAHLPLLRYLDGDLNLLTPL